MENEKYSFIYQTMNHKLKSIQKDDEFEKLIQERLTKSIERLNDQEIFELMCRSIFNGGFNSSILSDSWSKLQGEFNEFDVIEVNNFKNLTMQQFFERFQSFKNYGKIIACIQNAKVFMEIQKEHDDFSRYLKDFNDFEGIVKDLKSKFKYLGSATVYEFLREIGYDSAKPDVHLRRIMYRLGLLENDKDNHTNRSKIHETSKKIALAVGTKVSVVDAVFWLYGSGSTEYVQYGICTNNKPKCNECELKTMCKYTPP